MGVIPENSKKNLKEQLEKKMKDDVEILFFEKTEDINEAIQTYGSLTKTFLEELSDLSPKIKIKNIGMGDELIKKYNIETSPTVMIGENKGYKIVYNGAPLGNEASSFINTIVFVSQNKSGFSEENLKLINGIENEGLIQVFETLSCPYCSQSVLLANRIAIASKGKITVENIDSEENLSLAQEFNVSSVPQQVINKDKNSITIGVQKEEDFIKQILEYTSSK